MANYAADRKFSDYVHENLALKLIYEPLSWRPINLEQRLAQHLDMSKGIDYCFTDMNDDLITVQERFREQKYWRYNDITLRYRRDQNSNVLNVKSEFYKIEADYMVYGVVNASKFNHELASKFVKFAVLDMKALMFAFEKKLIAVKRVHTNQCFIENGVLVCPVNYNRDGSSSFVPVDLKLLLQCNIAAKIILYQQGYI